MKVLALLLLVLACGAARAQVGPLDYPSVWDCDDTKFNWYCDDRPAPPSGPPRPEPDKPGAARRELKDILTAEQLRAELKRREDIAVMAPTESNLKDYLALWQITQEKGALFADNWRRVVWQTPELDYSLKRPSNNAAIKNYDADHERRADAQLRALATAHGLIFFFRSDCPYCHAMAPLLKTLSAKYGIEVLGVSVDGGALPEFPHPRDGRAQAAAWGVERVPALFIGSKDTGDKAAIGFGAMALSDIVERIFTLTGTRPGENF